MHLVEPTGRKRKWDIRLRNHDGRVVRIPGDRDRDDARRLGERVEMLVRSKQNGDPPPYELQGWIDNMPAALADRLVELGLMDRQRFERGKSIDDLINKYQSIVASRKKVKPKHPRHQAGRVRIVCKALKTKQFDDLTRTAFLEYLESQKIASSTRRGYIIVMKDFTKEMVEGGFGKSNPFTKIKAPGQYEDPEYGRQPMSVAQFQKLMAHLDTFERYSGQRARWTAHDRKMIFWTAVKSAYRQSELRALRVCDLYLDDKPPVISLKARHTKNKTEGEVAIPDDLAAELKK